MQPIQSDFGHNLGHSDTGSHHQVPGYYPADHESVGCACDAPADGLG